MVADKKETIRILRKYTEKAGTHGAGLSLDSASRQVRNPLTVPEVAPLATVAVGHIVWIIEFIIITCTNVNVAARQD